MDITNKISNLIGEVSKREVDEMLDESKVTLKDVPKQFMSDPLYKAVLTAKDRKSYDEALKTLMSIRGRGAIDALKNAIKKGKK